MQRLPIVLVAVAVVGLIVFLANRPQRRSRPINDPIVSGDVGAQRPGSGLESSRSTRGDAERGGATERPSRFVAEKARRIDSLKQAKRVERGGSAGAETIVGQERRGGGSVGRAGGGRAAGGPGASRAGIADVPSTGGAIGQRRAEVVDRLAQAPRRDANDVEDVLAGDSEEPQNEDVVLSLPLSRDHGTTAEDSTPPLVEEDLTFSDEGDGINFNTNSVLAYPDAGNLRGDAGTMMLEIEPSWAGGDEGDYSLVNVRNPNDPRNMLRVIKNGKYLRYIFADESGQEIGVSYDISAWQPGEKHTVAVSWGQAATALYVDHQLVGQNTYQGRFEIPPGTPLYLGSDIPQAGPRGAGAVISNFHAFGRPLTPEEILNPPTE